jgi:hypothetical protein
MKSLFSRAIRRLLGTMPAPEPDPVKTQIWSIGIYTGDSPYSVRPTNSANNPVLTRASVSDVQARFVADPFMIYARGCWHMFFEALNSESGRGEIGLASSHDAAVWDYRKIVLRESFHLSYPYVFEWDNQFYMVPESYQANSVRLYRANDFPVSWSFVGDLLSGDDFEDSCVFRFNDRWWLITDHAKPPYYAGKLRLFYSDHLMGPWVEHPKSPVIDGNPHIARPAGRVVVWNDRVIRFTQDCSPIYGARVRAFEITELTSTAFREQQLGASPVLQGSGMGWNESGMHHIDPHPTGDGRWLACVDGWHWNSCKI